MRISFCILPDQPPEEICEAIEAADRFGFHAVYLADMIYHQDAWQILAVAARRTERIRLAAATNVVLKEPTYVAQQLLTLDRVSDGRALGLFSVGSIPMLRKYHVDIGQLRMIGRLREAHHVMRTILDSGTIDYNGRFFKYDGVFTSARGAQERIPLTLGGERGPKSFELAGEISDGLMTGMLYSPEALKYALDHVEAGTKRAGRKLEDLDLGAGLISAIAEDGQAARNAARVVAASFIPAVADETAERNGIDPKRLQPIKEAFSRGDLRTVIEMTPDDVADRLILPVGTPEEWVEQLKAVEALGYNHVCVTPIDATAVERLTGERTESIPTVQEQLRMIHEHVMPALESSSV
jgi:5,10-methylenetetrahydromethanopterin reductase